MFSEMGIAKIENWRQKKDICKHLLSVFFVLHFEIVFWNQMRDISVGIALETQVILENKRFSSQLTFSFCFNMKGFIFVLFLHILFEVKHFDYSLNYLNSLFDYHISADFWLTSFSWGEENPSFVFLIGLIRMFLSFPHMSIKIYLRIHQNHQFLFSFCIKLGSSMVHPVRIKFTNTNGWFFDWMIRVL